MPSISSSPQEEVGQSHLSRHTGLGSEVRGEPSAADARRDVVPRSKRAIVEGIRR